LLIFAEAAADGVAAREVIMKITALSKKEAALSSY
jgi:hypothetical protein